MTYILLFSLLWYKNHQTSSRSTHRHRPLSIWCSIKPTLGHDSTILNCILRGNYSGLYQIGEEPPGTPNPPRRIWIPGGPGGPPPILLQTRIPSQRSLELPHVLSRHPKREKIPNFTSKIRCFLSEKMFKTLEIFATYRYGGYKRCYFGSLKQLVENSVCFLVFRKKSVDLKKVGDLEEFPSEKSFKTKGIFVFWSAKYIFFRLRRA